MEASNIRNIAGDILARHKRNYQRIESKADSLRQQIVEANEQIEAAYTTFANTQFVQNASSFGRDVVDLVTKASVQKIELAQEAETIRARIKDLEATLDSLNNELLVERSAVGSLLDKDKRFIELALILHDKRSSLAEGQNNLGSLMKEATVKLADYANSGTFQYLLKSGFGTKNYSGKWLVRRLDEVLALKFKFTENFDNYTILNGIMNRSEKELSELESQYQQADTAFKTYEENAYKTDRILKLLDEISMCEDGILKSNTDLSSCYENINLIHQGSDSFSLNARSIIHKLILQKDIYSLEALANSTSSNDDNKALMVLSNAANIVEEKSKELSLAEQELRQSEQALQRAIDLKRMVESDNRLSGERYRYPNEHSVTDLLNNYMAGSIVANVLLSSLKSHSEYIPPPPPPSYSSSRSSIGGGGFSTSRSISSGSFKTTDSF